MIVFAPKANLLYSLAILFKPNFNRNMAQNTLKILDPPRKKYQNEVQLYLYM